MCIHVSVLVCLAGCASPSCCCGGGSSAEQPAPPGSAVWREPGGCRDILSAADAACGTLHQTRPSVIPRRQHSQQHWHRCDSFPYHSARHAALQVAGVRLGSPDLATVNKLPGLFCYDFCVHGILCWPACESRLEFCRGPVPAGTPRGAPDSQIKHCIDGLHGNALAVGALLVASARSALGAPSRLTSSVFWIAKRMISQPYCRCGQVCLQHIGVCWPPHACFSPASESTHQ